MPALQVMIRPWLIRRKFVDQALQIVGLEVVIPLAAGGIKTWTSLPLQLSLAFVGLVSFI